MRASRRIAQARWLQKNKGHFGGREEVYRVQLWRQANPGYWRKKTLPEGTVLSGELAKVAKEFALQDVIDTHFYLLTGLISHLIQSALQDEIAKELRRIIILGRGILKDTTRAAAWQNVGIARPGGTTVTRSNK
ncbi:MAG: hypothetical protein QM790_16125 [Nibricoccus sp.]